MKPEELIRKHIQNSLTEAEKKAFDALLQNDPDFAQQVAEFENVHAAITAHEKTALKSHLQQLETSSSKSKFKSLQIAVVVAILVVLGFIGNYFIQQNQSNETLYATYFEPYPNALAPVTRGEETSEETLQKAMRAYEDGNYQQTIDQLDEILATQQMSQTEILFYKAMSLLNLKKEREALDILRVIKHEKTRFTPQIYWYGALIHLKFKENDKARKALDYMDTIKTTYKAEARKILKEKL